MQFNLNDKYIFVVNDIVVLPQHTSQERREAMSVIIFIHVIIIL